MEKALNTYLEGAGEKFSVHLEPLDLNTFTQRMPLEFSSGGAGDVVFTASWVNSYYTNAAAGNYLALDDLLPKYAPKLWASLPKDIWDATRVKGKIYGVPNVQLWPMTYGFLARKDIADKYHLDPASIKTYEDLEPYLADIKAGEPGKTVLYTDNVGSGSAWAYGANYFDLVGGTFGVAVRPDDPNLTLINVFDTDEFRTACTLMRKWYTAGYMAKNPPSPTDAGASWSNGQTLIELAQVNGNGLPAFPTVGKSLTAPLLTTSSVLGTLSAVNRDTRAPEHAVAFLERLNTDKDFYNLICFGIEGKHYVFTDKKRGVVGLPPGVTAAKDGYNPNSDWQFGNQFNAYYRSAAQAKSGLWQTDQKLNESAKRSGALGFSPDTTSIKREVANLTSVVTEYRIPNSLGQVDPSSGIPEFVGRLKNAGMSKVLSELQKQIDAWHSAK
ncbi:ABC transporter substrate-binding protein [Streptomyces sp. NPDC004752]